MLIIKALPSLLELESIKTSVPFSFQFSKNLLDFRLQMKGRPVSCKLRKLKLHVRKVPNPDLCSEDLSLAFPTSVRHSV